MKRFWIILTLVLISIITLVSLFLEKPFFKKEVVLINHRFETFPWKEEEDTLKWEYQFAQLYRHFKKPVFQEAPEMYIYRDDESVARYADKFNLSHDQEKNDLGNFINGILRYDVKEYENALEAFNKISVNNAWVHYYKGKTQLKLLDRYKAEKEFLSIPEQAGVDTLRYDGLTRLYYYTEQYDKLAPLLLQPHALPYFTSHMKANCYFHNGDWGNYLGHRLFSGISYEILLVSFLMTLAWIIYLGQYQLFTSRQWLLYILSFSLTVFLTDFCLIVYDFYHFILRFRESGDFFNDLLYTIAGIGFIEESTKYIPLLIMVLLMPKLFKDPVSIAIAAGCSAFGFSFLENQMYIQIYYSPFSADIISTRGIAPLILHLCLTVIASYGLIKLKFASSGSWLDVLKYFALAIVLHGVYDFFLISDSVSAIYFFSYLILLAALLMMNTVINNALNLSPYFEHGHHLRLNKARIYLATALVSVMMVQYLYNALYLGAYQAGIYLLDDMLPFLILIIFLVTGFSNMQMAHQHLFPLFSSMFKKNKFPFLTDQTITLEASKESSGALRYPLTGEIIGMESFDGVAEYFLFQENESSEYYILRMRTSEAVKGGYSILVYTTVGELTADGNFTRKLQLIDKARLRPEYIPKKFNLANFNVKWKIATAVTFVCFISFFYYYMNYTVSRKYLRRAQEEIASKNLSDALNLTKSALYFDGKNEEAYMVLARLTYYLGSHEYVIKVLNTLKAETGVNNGVTNYIRGKCRIHIRSAPSPETFSTEEEINQMIEEESKPYPLSAFQDAAEYADAPDSCFYYIGLIQFNSMNYGKAIPALETYRNRHPEASISFYLMLAKSYYDLRKEKEAMKLFNIILQKDDKCGEAYYYKGLHLKSQNMIPEACTEFANAVTYDYEGAEKYISGLCDEYYKVLSSDTIQN